MNRKTIILLLFCIFLCGCNKTFFSSQRGSHFADAEKVETHKQASANKKTTTKPTQNAEALTEKEKKLLQKEKELAEKEERLLQKEKELAEREKALLKREK